PELTLLAYGGPRMAAAGATLLELTTEKPAMLADAVGQVWSHRQRVARFEKLMQQGLADGASLAAHVPVDSPAANWALCEAVRRHRPESRVVHLVAPQMWAWAPGRVVKLRRLSDMVLCLLPFEPEWFGAHGIPTRYVGHPL